MKARLFSYEYQYLISFLHQDYGARRYGKKNPLVSKALRLLSNSVYNANATVRNFHGHVLILRPPQLGMKVSSKH